MYEPKKLNQEKIVLSHIGSVTERYGAPFLERRFFLVNQTLH